MRNIRCKARKHFLQKIWSNFTEIGGSCWCVRWTAVKCYAGFPTRSPKWLIAVTGNSDADWLSQIHHSPQYKSVYHQNYFKTVLLRWNSYIMSIFTLVITHHETEKSIQYNCSICMLSPPILQYFECNSFAKETKPIINKVKEEFDWEHNFSFQIFYKYCHNISIRILYATIIMLWKSDILTVQMVIMVIRKAVF